MQENGSNQTSSSNDLEGSDSGISINAKKSRLQWRRILQYFSRNCRINEHCREIKNSINFLLVLQNKINI